MLISKRRVVVTGMGILSPLGTGVDHVWQNLIAGQSGIRAVTNFDVSDITSRVAGQVPDGDGSNGTFNPDDYIEPKEQKKIDRFIMLGMAAATQAITDSGWVPETEEDQFRTGVMVGSGIGGLNEIYNTTLLMAEKGPRRISPFFIPASLINLASGQISIQHGFKGPNHSVVTACSTGAHAIGDAARLIMYDDADVMVAGGTEAAVNRLGMGGFAALRALSSGYNDDPTAASRPFDDGRDGFVIAEGAGVVVLEELEHAKARGARIYGEIVGYGMSGDAHHITSPPPDGNGGYRAMQAALKSAGVEPSQIDYINAHGTSTPVGDEIEVGAIKRMLGDAVKTASMSSTKSAIGHLLGAAGAVEAIFCLKAMNDSILPPTLNLNNPSDACAGIDLVPKVAKEKKVKIALSNSFGFGGTNASLVFKALRGNLVSIIKASIYDLPLLIELRHKAFSHFAPAFYSPAEVQTLLNDVDTAQWQTLIEANTFFVFKEDRAILGCCGWNKNSIRHLYVDPSYTRKGIASRLLQYTENDFKNRTGQIEILAGIAIYARKFYESNGYIVLSEEKDWDGSAYFKTKKTLKE